MTTIFDSHQLGALRLNNRLVMPPLTRARSTQPGDAPNAMMAEYYGQRASAGLVIAEATDISPQGKGYSNTPGIYSAEQIAGWKLVTDEVHAKGGVIFLQIWHTGRMSHPSFHKGALPVSPSAVPFEGQIWLDTSTDGSGSMVDCPTPRALETAEIPLIVEDFCQAAKNAMEAGFDGVEIHGANSYLIDQFLRTTSNVRVDQYGGSRENRLRFLNEIVVAVSGAIGAERVGVRLSPYITARGMNCPDILPTILEAAARMNRQGVAYLHIAEAEWSDAPKIDESFRKELRQNFPGTLIMAGLYDLERANKLLGQGYADLVAFGRSFIANPDLPARLENNWPLNVPQPASFFGGSAQGYTTYPTYKLDTQGELAGLAA